MLANLLKMRRREVAADVARGEMIASHHALSDTSDRFDLSEKGWGGLGEKSMAPALVAVENAA